VGGHLLRRRHALWDGAEEKFRAGLFQGAPGWVTVGAVVPALSGDAQEAQATTERDVHARVVTEGARAWREVMRKHRRSLDRAIVGRGGAVGRRGSHGVIALLSGSGDTYDDITDDRRSTGRGLSTPVAEPLAEGTDTSACGVAADGTLERDQCGAHVVVDESAGVLTCGVADESCRRPETSTRTPWAPVVAIVIGRVSGGILIQRL
jgi:hypothetical protein